MRRIFASLALIVVLAAPVLAQTNTQNPNQDPNYQTNPNNPANTTNDQNNTLTSPNATTLDNTNNTSSTTDQTMPATASPLPLVLFSGLAALASGLWLGRRRQA